MTAPKPDGPTGLMTDEEVDALFRSRASIREFARVIEREARESQRRSDIKWVRAFARDCGCAREIEVAINRGGGPR